MKYKGLVRLKSDLRTSVLIEDDDKTVPLWPILDEITRDLDGKPVTRVIGNLRIELVLNPKSKTFVRVKKMRNRTRLYLETSGKKDQPVWNSDVVDFFRSLYLRKIPTIIEVTKTGLSVVGKA